MSGDIETVPIGGVRAVVWENPGGGCHRTRGWAGCAPPVLAGTRGGGGFVRRGGVVRCCS